jgi:chemotaxis signal transduction protein
VDVLTSNWKPSKASVDVVPLLCCVSVDMMCRRMIQMIVDSVNAVDTIDWMRVNRPHQQNHRSANSIALGVANSKETATSGPVSAVQLRWRCVCVARNGETIISS